MEYAASKLTVALMLSVRNGAKAITFYNAAFGATELFRTESPHGAVVAQLSIGSSEFWLADESPEHQNISPDTLGASTSRMIVLPGDPGAVFDRTVWAGADRHARRRSALWLACRPHRRSVRPSLGDR